MKKIGIAAVPLVAAFSISGCGHYLPSAGWVSVIDGERIKWRKVDIRPL